MFSIFSILSFKNRLFLPLILVCRVNPALDNRVNAGFRGKWLNSANIGKSEAEIIALWNEAHPDDPVEA